MWFTDGPEAQPRAPDRPRYGRVGTLAAPRRFGRAAASAIRCKRGVYAYEFALIAPLLMFMVMGGVEMAWQGIISVAVENALLKATRTASLGCQQADGTRSGPASKNQIIAAARAAGSGFLGGSSLDVSSKAYGTLKSANDRSGGTVGTGLGGQIVEYTLTYNRPLLFSFLAARLNRTTYAHGGTVTIKNEPFPDGGAGAAACS